MQVVVLWWCCGSACAAEDIAPLPTPDTFQWERFKLTQELPLYEQVLGVAEWERFRVRPALFVSEMYSDNIYLNDEDKVSDFVTILNPKLALDFAFAPRNYLTLSYDGYYRFYGKSDNFKQDVHHTGIFWTWDTPKGSSIKVGARADFDAVQPYSATDHYKDYRLEEIFADTAFKLGSVWDLGLRYSHLVERFKDDIEKINDFDRDAITVSAAYSYFANTAFIAQYTYAYQNNKDPLFSDFDSHTGLVGIRLDPTLKLSGTIMAGYYLTKFKAGEDASGFALDSDITYKPSDVTSVRLLAFRRFVSSSLAARDTGDFYISTGAILTMRYERFAPFRILADFAYIRNKYNQRFNIAFQERTDNYYAAGLTAEYRLWRKLTIALVYRHRENDSDIESETYKENRAEARLVLSL